MVLNIRINSISYLLKKIQIYYLIYIYNCLIRLLILFIVINELRFLDS